MYNSIKSRFLPVFLATLSGVALAQITQVGVLEHDTKRGLHNFLMKVNDNIFALAYRGDANDGHITTFTISADGTSITQLGSLEHDTEYAQYNSLVRVNDNTIALAYRYDKADVTVGYIKTFTISADGTSITEEFSLEHDTDRAYDNSLVKVDEDLSLIHI